MKRFKGLVIGIAAILALEPGSFAISGEQVYAASKSTVTSSKSTTSKSTAASKKISTSQKNSTTKKKKRNGLYNVNGRYCYMVNGKKIRSTWKTVKGKKYYFAANGYAVTKRRTIRGKIYLFNGKGQLICKKEATVVKFGSYKYFVNLDGSVNTGWFKAENGHIYYADSKGRLQVNKVVGGVALNHNGCAKYDYYIQVREKVKGLLDSITTADMSDYEKLRKCFNYVVYNYGYSSYYYPNLSQDQWWAETADRMITTGVGNCYGFACLFAALAKEIGFEPYVICGRVSGTRDGAGDGLTRHCWVYINGAYYDPEAAYGRWMDCYGLGQYPIAHTVQKMVLY